MAAVAAERERWKLSRCLLTCPQYLHRFHWTHLSERLAYEQTVLQQRLRTEVSQAKRETNFYLNNVDKSAHLEKMRKKTKRQGQQVKPSPLPQRASSFWRGAKMSMCPCRRRRGRGTSLSARRRRKSR